MRCGWYGVVLFSVVWCGRCSMVLCGVVGMACYGTV